jgi:hypothetical protein
MAVWVQTPRPGVHDGDRFLPFGAPPGTTETLGALEAPLDRYDWSFSGQVNHNRRREAVEALRSLTEDQDDLVYLLNPTRGFSRGLDRKDYLATLSETKVAPCPSGPHTPDTFRVWEALHAGCLPLVDEVCPDTGGGFWEMLFQGPAPFPTVRHWAEAPDQVHALLDNWPVNATRCSAAWQRWQRDLKWRVADDIADRSGTNRRSRGNITVLIPTSPIPSHPSTEVIETTVASVRHHLPDAEIIVMCDGVRPEQEHRRAAYEEYLHRLVQLTANRWGACVPVIFDEHAHQANMTRETLSMVRSPLVLFVEHDTPLTEDNPIEWDLCERAILDDHLDVVRFHYESTIPSPHQRLMFERYPKPVGGLPVIRTRQWSQRPHLASTRYYRRAIRDNFPPNCRTMIEDKMHGVCQDERWARNRLGIYAVDPANLKRSWTVDGRKDDPMFDMDYGTWDDDAVRADSPQ